MTNKLERVWQPNPWRAVDFKESSILKALQQGFLWVEPKVDGIRCIIRVEADGVRPYTREGILIQSLEAYFKELYLAGVFSVLQEGTCLDGEVLIEGLTFEESSGVLRRKTALAAKHKSNLKVYLFTALKEQEGSLADDTEALTAPLLNAVVMRCPVFKRLYGVSCRSLDEIHECYEDFRAEGYEGAIIKDPRKPYQNGKKTGWWKLKPSITVGGVVTGVRYGDAGKANEGKVVGVKVLLEDDTECTATGLTQAQIAEFTKNQAAIVGRAVEVEAMERTADGNLRHPRFKRFRDFEGAEGVEQ